MPATLSTNFTYSQRLQREDFTHQAALVAQLSEYIQKREWGNLTPIVNLFKTLPLYKLALQGVVSCSACGCLRYEVVPGGSRIFWTPPQTFGSRNREEQQLVFLGRDNQSNSWYVSDLVWAAQHTYLHLFRLTPSPV